MTTNEEKIREYQKWEAIRDIRKSEEEAEADELLARLKEWQLEKQERDEEITIHPSRKCRARNWNAKL